MSGFQTQVNNNPAYAVAGDFATANPRAAVVAPEAGFVAGVGGVTVGKFAWIAADGRTVHNYGTYPNAPAGFIHRDQQALITEYLGEASMVIPVGMPVTIQRTGDYYGVVTGSTAATLGATVYADYDSGDITIGSAATGASATGIIGSTNTASLGATFTASADTDDTRLVVTAVTGLISVGDVVSGTGITAGTKITSQVSGTTGAAGTYQLDASNTASAATVTCFGTHVKVTATTGLISVGDTVAGGAGFPVGATVVSQASGTTGGAGVYVVSAAGSAYTASATGVTTYGVKLNITAVGSGALGVGMPVTGTGVPSNAVITAQNSGTVGGIGVYTISVAASAYAASTAITAVGGVSTSWRASLAAPVGDLTVITL